MNIKLNYNLPKIFKFLLALGGSLMLTLLVNFTALEIVNRPIKILNKDSFESTSQTLKENDTVIVNANINYLRVLSNKGESIYYVGFEEFGDRLIARINSDKIKNSASLQIQGIVKSTDNSFGDELISKLNEAGTVDIVNNSDLKKLDEGVKQKIAENLKGNFTEGSYLVVEGSGFEREQVYLDTILLGLFFAMFIIILLREEIFYN